MLWPFFLTVLFIEISFSSIEKLPWELSKQDLIESVSLKKKLMPKMLAILLQDYGSKKINEAD